MLGVGDGRGQQLVQQAAIHLVGARHLEHQRAHPGQQDALSANPGRLLVGGCVIEIRARGGVDVGLYAVDRRAGAEGVGDVPVAHLRLGEGRKRPVVLTAFLDPVGGQGEHVGVLAFPVHRDDDVVTGGSASW